MFSVPQSARRTFATILQVERRRRPRIPVDLPASITVLSENLAGNPAARMLNLSATGLKITSNQPLPEDAYVEIHCSAFLVFGQVVYSRPSGEQSFHSGILITSAFSYSENNGKNHLTPTQAALFLAGHLSRASHEAASRHIKTCENCRNALAAMQTPSTSTEE